MRDVLTKDYYDFHGHAARADGKRDTAMERRHYLEALALVTYLIETPFELGGQAAGIEQYMRRPTR